MNVLFLKINVLRAEQDFISFTYMKLIKQNISPFIKSSLMMIIIFPEDLATIYSMHFTYHDEIYLQSCSSEGKESACSVRGPGSIPESERSPGEGNGNPLQHSCLENSMNRGAWQATVPLGLQRVRHNWATSLSFSFSLDTHMYVKSSAYYYFSSCLELNGSLGFISLVQGCISKQVMELKSELKPDSF